MTNNHPLQSTIAAILRAIGNKKCLVKAEVLERESAAMSSLHLRDLELTSSDVVSILSCLQRAKDGAGSSLRSISFSYNPLLGDAGVIALVDSLPTSIREIGLVGCGISDIGGAELLQWLKRLPLLQMICVEQNDFSEKSRAEFSAFSATNPGMVVIY